MEAERIQWAKASPRQMCAVRSQAPNIVTTSMNSIANIVSESIKASELQCLLGFISFILVVNNQSVNNNTVLQLGIYDIDLNGATVASDCCFLCVLFAPPKTL